MKYWCVKGSIMDDCVLLTETPECVVSLRWAITRPAAVDFMGAKHVSLEYDKPFNNIFSPTDLYTIYLNTVLCVPFAKLLSQPLVHSRQSVALNCARKSARMVLTVYGSGHETVAALLPGFAIIAKAGNKTAAVSWHVPYFVKKMHSMGFDKS